MPETNATLSVTITITVDGRSITKKAKATIAVEAWTEEGLASVVRGLVSGLQVKE